MKRLLIGIVIGFSLASAVALAVPIRREEPLWLWRGAGAKPSLYYSDPYEQISKETGIEGDTPQDMLIFYECRRLGGAKVLPPRP